MPFVACIGSRVLPPWLQILCESYGSFYAERKIRVATGNAPGADQAYALGASVIDPALVDLYLPWLGFEERAIVEGNKVRHAGMASRLHWELAQAAHPAWDRQPESVRKILVRNAMIVAGLDGEKAMGVVAAPDSTKLGYGGTGHAMRIARLLGIEVLLLPSAILWNGW